MKHFRGNYRGRVVRINSGGSRTVRFFVAAVLFLSSIPAITQCREGYEWVSTSFGGYCDVALQANTQSGAAGDQQSKCAHGTWVSTSFGGYCAGTNVNQPTPEVQSPPTVYQPSRFKPAIPITPLYPNGPQGIDADFSVDLQLGFSNRSRYLAGASELSPAALSTNAEGIFEDLVHAGFGQSYPWKLTLVNNNVLNAASNAAGQVFVYGDMIKLLDNDRGLWAAVLSHEVSHTGLRHQVRSYLAAVNAERTRAYYRARIQAGDKSANWGLIAFNIAYPIAQGKLQREMEHDADRIGMFVMARAGYHPDYVFALHHKLLSATGDQSKFGAFFSDHPRWETRDQRTEKSYSDALQEFQKYWPDAANSPGGMPPMVAFLGTTTDFENKNTKTLDVRTSVYCRNSNDPITIALIFEKNGALVKSLDPIFANKDGNLVARKVTTCEDKNDAQPIIFAVPASVTTNDNRKMKASVWVLSNGGQVLVHGREFDVKFPKR